MNLASIFLEMAKSGTAKSPQPAVTSVNVILKYCECACIQTPHIRRSDYLECAWCQNKVYPHGRTDAES